MAFLVFGLLAWVPLSATADEAAPRDLLKSLSGALAGRRIPEAEEPGGAIRLRGGLSLRDIYRRTIGAVPLVVSPGGTGSAVVIAVNAAESSGWVITNHHVVEKPFRDKQGRAVVVLLFYDALLASEPFDEERLVRCVEAGGGAGWCDGLLRSIRIGVVVGTDPARDLALLHVTNVPRGILPIQEAGIESVEPGDDVATIGHPRGFLWSLTRGIVSGVRQKYPTGNSLGTVIQTQAPIAPGNSGGPLLTLDGRLVGVIAWAHQGAQALNGAIAINEVQAFAAELAARFRQR